MEGFFLLVELFKRDMLLMRDDANAHDIVGEGNQPDPVSFANKVVCGVDTSEVLGSGVGGVDSIVPVRLG